MKKFLGCSASRDLKTHSAEMELGGISLRYGVYEELSLPASLCRVLMSDSAWDISSVEIPGSQTRASVAVDKREVRVFLPPFFP